jgi:hypothetical protein
MRVASPLVPVFAGRGLVVTAARRDTAVRGRRGLVLPSVKVAPPRGSGGAEETRKELGQPLRI